MQEKQVMRKFFLEARFIWSLYFILLLDSQSY